MGGLGNGKGHYRSDSAKVARFGHRSGEELVDVDGELLHHDKRPQLRKMGPETVMVNVWVVVLPY